MVIHLYFYLYLLYIMNIDINLIKQLRDATFAPLGDCKNALVEAEGDLEKAQEVLRKKGIAKAWKKAGRETNAGLIRVAHNNWKTYVLKLLCETDFVAKNETFLGLFDKIFDELKGVDGEISSFEELDASLAEKINTLIAEAVGSIWENMKVWGLHITSENAYAYSHPGDKVVSLIYYTWDESVAKELALQVAALDPDYLTFDDVPAEEKEKLKAEFTEELKKQGKPENMIENIVKGKINKAFADVVLLEQEYIRDGAKKVKEIIPAGFEIKKFYRFAV